MTRRLMFAHEVAQACGQPCKLGCGQCLELELAAEHTLLATLREPCACNRDPDLVACDDVAAAGMATCEGCKDGGCAP